MGEWLLKVELGIKYPSEQLRQKWCILNFLLYFPHGSIGIRLCFLVLIYNTGMSGFINIQLEYVEIFVLSPYFSWFIGLYKKIDKHFKMFFSFLANNHLKTKHNH